MVGDLMGIMPGEHEMARTSGPPGLGQPKTNGFDFRRLLGNLGNFGQLAAQDQDAMTTQLAQQGPPPQVQMAPPVGQSLVGEQYAALLEAEKRRRMAGPPMGNANPMALTRGEAMTNPTSGVGGSLTGGY